MPRKPWTRPEHTDAELAEAIWQAHGDMNDAINRLNDLDNGFWPMLTDQERVRVEVILALLRRAHANVLSLHHVVRESRGNAK